MSQSSSWMCSDGTFGCGDFHASVQWYIMLTILQNFTPWPTFNPLPARRRLTFLSVCSLILIFHAINVESASPLFFRKHTQFIGESNHLLRPTPASNYSPK